jgi:ribonuclease BN (tRNA processing enzyme)
MAQLSVAFLGTGAGRCIHRAHTAIVLDCPDGARLLLGVGSGNSVMRHGAALGLMPEEFGPVLLTHHHGSLEAVWELAGRGHIR